MTNDISSEYGDCEGDADTQIGENVDYVAEDSGIPLVGIIQKVMLTPRQPQETQRSSIFKLNAQWKAKSVTSLWTVEAVKTLCQIL